jgi:hypothetical protein
MYLRKWAQRLLFLLWLLTTHSLSHSLSTLDSRLSTLDSRLSTLDSRLSTLDPPHTLAHLIQWNFSPPLTPSLTHPILHSPTPPTNSLTHSPTHPLHPQCQSTTITINLLLLPLPSHSPLFPFLPHSSLSYLYVDYRNGTAIFNLSSLLPYVKLYMIYHSFFYQLYHYGDNIYMFFLIHWVV